MPELYDTAIFKFVKRETGRPRKAIPVERGPMLRSHEPFDLGPNCTTFENRAAASNES